MNKPTPIASIPVRCYKPSDFVELNKSNEVVANTLKNSTISLSGKVKAIEKDNLNNPYLIIVDDANENSDVSVQCYFQKGDQSKLILLSPNQRIVISGKYKGKQFSNIVFDDCNLVRL